MSDILCENRNKVRAILKENGIICRPLGAPLHKAPFLYASGSYEDAARLQSKILYLPCGPDQDFKNVEYVIKVLKTHDLR